MKKISLSLFSFLICAFCNAQLTGTQNIPGSFATLDAAITQLNTVGVGAGGVTLNVVAGNPQTAPAGGYVIGNTGSVVLTTSSAANQVTIQGNGNIVTAFTPQTVGNINDAIFKLIGADYITLTGFTMQENAGNTISATSATNNMTEFGVALFYVTTTDGSQNNTIQTNTISLNRTYLNTLGIFSTSRTSATVLTVAADATSTAGANSNNKIYTNSISNVNFGIVFIGNANPANMDTGNDIGGSSSGNGNTITNWGGGGVLTGFVLNITGNNYCIFSNHQINDNVSYNTITSAALTNTVTAGGFLKNYSSAAPTGTITTTINNNTVTVTNNPPGTTTGGIIGLNSQGITALLSTATITMNNNIVQNCVLGGSTATTTGITAMTNLSAAGTINITGNSILNNNITATSATTAQFTGISNSGAGGTLNITNNIIRGFLNSSPAITTGALTAISNSGAVTTAINITGNQLGNAAGDLLNITNGPAGINNLIQNSAGTAASTLNISNNAFRGANMVTATQLIGIFNTSGFVGSSVTMSNNTFGSGATGNFFNLSGTNTASITGFNNAGGSATGSFTASGNDFRGFTNAITASSGIIAINSSFAALNHTITNNTFTNLSINTTGSVTLISNNVTVPAGGTQTISNNSIITAFAKTAAGGTVTGIVSGGSSTTVTSNWNNNNFSNITVSGATGITAINCQDGGTVNHNITGNTINNITAGTSAVTGIFSDFGGGNAGGSVVSGNTVTNITSLGAIVGINIGTTAGTNTLSGNTIGGFASSGVSAVQGIVSAASAANSISRNKIYDLSGSNAASTVDGIAITAGPSHTIFNNLVGDLRTPAANAANPLNGLNITNSVAGNVVNVYFNTIYLNATSVGAVFGSSAVSSTVAPTINSTDNIMVNKSVANTSGFTVVTRRSTTDLTTLGASSNNNDFFAGTPSASNLIYYDGTNADQTLAAYQARVTPRNSASISVDPNFRSLVGTSPLFLHIDALIATPLDGGGTPVSGITTDFDNDTRNASTPDIGADEFTFGVLAVTTEYFRGSKVAGANYLDWKVTTTDPSVRLILERSADGRNFKSIQDQTATAARCAQGFNYTDAAPLAGINYYRLKTISPDGAFKYSVIVALLNKEKGFELISVAPNPVKDNAILSLTSVKGGKMNISVSDITGKVIMTRSLNVIAGNNPINMNFATLGAGTYNIKVINADNEVKTTRFVKY